jgi:hypothetical protein
LVRRASIVGRSIASRLRTGLRTCRGQGLRSGDPSYSDDRQKGHDVGPFGLALGKIEKNVGKSGPGSESAFKGANVKLSQVAVGATGGYFAVPAEGVGPIGEQFAVLEPHVQGKWLESGGAHGVIPSREELRDLMLGDS